MKVFWNKKKNKYETIELGFFTLKELLDYLQENKIKYKLKLNNVGVFEVRVGAFKDTPIYLNENESEKDKDNS